MSERNNNSMNNIRNGGSNVSESNNNNLNQILFHEDASNTPTLNLINGLSPNQNMNNINAGNRNSLGAGYNFSNLNRDNTINIQHAGINEFFLMSVHGNNTININTINSSNNTNIRINNQNCSNCKSYINHNYNI